MQQLMPFAFLFLYLVVHAKDQFANARAQLMPGFRHAHAVVAGVVAVVFAVLLPALFTLLLGWHSIAFVAMSVLLLGSVLWMLLTLSGWLSWLALGVWLWLCAADTGREFVRQLASGQFELQAMAILTIGAIITLMGGIRLARLREDMPEYRWIKWDWTNGRVETIGQQQAIGDIAYAPVQGLGQSAANGPADAPRPTGIRLVVVGGVSMASGNDLRLVVAAVDSWRHRLRWRHNVVGSAQFSQSANEQRRFRIFCPDVHTRHCPCRRHRTADSLFGARSDDARRSENVHQTIRRGRRMESVPTVGRHRHCHGRLVGADRSTAASVGDDCRRGGIFRRSSGRHVWRSGLDVAVSLEMADRPGDDDSSPGGIDIPVAVVHFAAAHFARRDVLDNRHRGRARPADNVRRLSPLAGAGFRLTADWPNASPPSLTGFQ